VKTEPNFGDAMLADGGSGLVAADVRWNAPAETLVPDDRARGRYDELYRVYRSLYPATVEQAHAVARISEKTAAAGRA
jgi:xylulokinase